MIRILLFTLIPLAFFGAGVLFASLVWGKYKQLAVTLRQRNDTLANREAELDEKLVQSQARANDVETTCHTLEEELASIATEREQLQSELRQTQAGLSESQGQTRDLSATKKALAEALESQHALATEVETLQTNLRATENQMAAQEQEKKRYLNLVNKLQAGIEQVDGLRHQLREREDQARRLGVPRRKGPTKRWRRVRASVEEPNLRRHRALGRRRPQRPSQAKQPEAVVVTTPVETPKPINQETRAPKPGRPAAAIAPTPVRSQEERPKSAKEGVLRRLLGGRKKETGAGASKTHRHW